MRDYRQEARQAYIVAAQVPIRKLYNANCAKKLCAGSINRLENYIRDLCRHFIYIDADLSKELDLFPLEYFLHWTKSGQEGKKHHIYNVHTCSAGISGCICKHPTFDFDESVVTAMESCSMGREGECALCLQCFTKGEFALEKSCELHPYS